MSDYADLEIGLHRLDGVSWRAELRYSQAKSDVDVNVGDRPLTVMLDPDALARMANDAVSYGCALGEALIGGELGSGYREASAVAMAHGATLRVRLRIGPDAAELHQLHWETMRDPRDGSPLLTDENLVFSRYLTSMDWRPAPLRPKSDLRALVVAAGGSDVDQYGVDRALAPVNVQEEVERARAGLKPLVPHVLAGSDATEERLYAELRDGCDILYLVCHGYRAPSGDAVLLLEDGRGKVAPVRGSALLERIRDLQRLPRLVVLASCQSAGDPHRRRSDDRGALAALGPRLAAAGVPAVLAMQGNVTMATIADFMPVFFRELQRDGQLDRAVAAARAAVNDHDDWWVPVLFMRLRSGRIWYESGVGWLGEKFDLFPALVHEIRKQNCTPILGPGLSDQLFGSRQKVAQRWAKTYHFPMAPQLRDDLPQVAQFLSVALTPEFPRDELGRYLRDELIDDLDPQPPAPYRNQPKQEHHLGELISEAWRVRHTTGEIDPYAVLARLPIELYVTTQPWNLMAEALRAAKKEPQVETCQWKRLDDPMPRDGDWWEGGPEVELDPPDWAFRVEQDPARRRAVENAGWPRRIREREPGYRPSENRPLVYHLFGHLARPRSLVLTEDEYFDFLIGVTKEKDMIPYGVRRAFADSSLMFLGFRLDEWDFRVLFRSILSQEGGLRRSDYPHVAVQIDPEEGRTMEPERARWYLDQYFQNSKIKIYWGSTESFAKELGDAWDEQP